MTNTFDLPLWIKVTRIVLETGMRIVVNQTIKLLSGLGASTLLRVSFLGCIGCIMADSGLEKLFCSGDVTHISDGRSYYKTLRAHFLIINKCVNENLGVNV